MYKTSLKALKKANRYRKRVVYSDNIIDLSSNDYLGLSQNKKVLKKAYKKLKKQKYHSPKASQLVNGYHQIHKSFEEYLCEINGFESSIVVGSGFLANMALIETLPRRGDILILDEEYHASGILASKLLSCEVKFFKHNDETDLKNILQTSKYNRAIVAVEGIYSMEADILNPKIFDICDEFNALLIIDEAHSSGVVGKNLIGVFEYYNITPKPNHIKMGTLGKAYGSYGAYILANQEIIEFLTNRAKAIIYATSPSLFDIALAHEGMKFTQKRAKKINKKIKFIQKMVYKDLNIKMQGLILKIDIASSLKVLQIRDNLSKKGYLIGAIRPPTVKSAILRIIPRVNIKKRVLKKFLNTLKKNIYN